ncbi:hypothetical protein [Levilactobacillus angrenensis]|uniref:Uncharacterized protein n=1 Tax=Levilactobacillus angrenensis TaxID=2486020 RepID=A0ABW1UDP7_9LACO|nr:hypothetical protein [Levilactobacillus angrenensis]
MGKLVKRCRGMIVLVAAVLVGVGMLNQVQTPTAQAQATSSYKALKNVPKKMRGTWYHYFKGRGLYQLVIKKHHLREGFVKDGLYSLPSLTIHKLGRKHKRTVYAFNSKTHPADGPSYATYVKKIKGKKRHVLIEPQQDATLKPTVFTHFKPKKEYFTALSVEKQFA